MMVYTYNQWSKIVNFGTISVGDHNSEKRKTLKHRGHPLIRRIPIHRWHFFGPFRCPAFNFHDFAIVEHSLGFYMGWDYDCQLEQSYRENVHGMYTLR